MRCAASSICCDSLGLKKGTACVICFESEGDHVLMPCGHGGYCGACAQTLLKHRKAKRVCPMCRTTLSAVAKTDIATPVGQQSEVLKCSVVKPSADHKSQHSRGPSQPRGRSRTAHNLGGQRESLRNVRLLSAEVVASRRDRRVRRALRTPGET